LFRYLLAFRYISKNNTAQPILLLVLHLLSGFTLYSTADDNQLT